METILSLTVGLLIGAISASAYFLKRYTNVSKLLNDKLLVNDLLKQEFKAIEAKKSKKYYRQRGGSKKHTNSAKQ